MSTSKYRGGFWLAAILSLALILTLIPLSSNSTANAGSPPDNANNDTLPAQAGDAAQEHANGGLGQYGATGTITRDQVPNKYVSQRAIEVANSPRFTDIRESWEDEAVDFVDQLDYQIEYRGKYNFLSNDISHIENVMRNRSSLGEGIQLELQLYLTDTEVAEFNRRSEVAKKQAAVKSILVTRDPVSEEEVASGDFSYGPAFGGSWVDPNDDGKVKVAVVEGYLTTSLEARMKNQFKKADEEFEIVTVKYSYDELLGFTEAVLAVVEGADPSVVGVPYVATDEVSNTVIIEGIAQFDVPGVPSDALSFVLSAPSYTDVSGPKYSHGSRSAYGGLGVVLSQGGYATGPGSHPNAVCTTGFSMSTSSYYYLSTAAHCLGFVGTTITSGGISGYSYDVYASAGQSAGGTRIASDGYIYARYGGVYDVARFQNEFVNASSCYHSNNDSCTYRIQYRKSLYNHSVGNNVCASLAKSNTYRCGSVTATNVSFNGITGMFKWNDKSVRGDSGAGVKWDYTAHGSLAFGEGKWTFYGWTIPFFSNNNTLVIPAYRLVNGLGANIVCTNPPQKGHKCPVV